MARISNIKDNILIERDDYCEVHVNNCEVPYLIDKNYLTYVKKFHWFATSSKNRKHRYMIRKDFTESNGIRTFYHTDIMKDEIEKFKKENRSYNKRVIIDHINGNTFDNRKENLRVRTQSENNMNKTIQSNNTTNFVGVTWHIKQKMWNSKISIDEKAISLGSFYYMRNALRARIDAENKYFGEHAYYLRNEEYMNKVKEILSLPYIPEPVFFSGLSPNDKTDIRGITYNDKNKKKYTVRMKEYKTRLFSTIEEAIEYKDEIWKLKYGERLPMLKSEKIEKLI